MTIREAYEQALIHLNKKGAPALYLEDFLVLFNNAIQNKVNELYALYQTSQQLADDLQNLHRHVFIDVDTDVPYPFNIDYYDGTPFVQFNGSYELPAASSSADFYFLDGNGKYSSDLTTEDGIYQNAEFVASGVAVGSILDQIRLGDNISNVIFKVSVPSGGIVILRDWREDNGDAYPWSFDLGGSSTVTVTEGNPVYLRFNGNNYDLVSGTGYEYIDDERVLVSAPDNYLHLLGLATSVGIKKNITCEGYNDKKYGAARLTSDREVSIRQNSFLEPKAKRPYFSIKNNFNSVYPNIEITYRKASEKELVKLNKIELIYLKEPNFYNLLDEELDGDDNTEKIEFQEYICQEIVKEVVEIILENNSDARVQSFPYVNESTNMSRGLVKNNK